MWLHDQGKMEIVLTFLEALGMMENDLVELNRVDDNGICKDVFLIEQSK